MKSVCAFGAALVSVGASAQTPNFDAVQIKTIKVAQNIYVLEGQGGNIGVSVGDDGIMAIEIKNHSPQRAWRQNLAPCGNS